jgi:type IV secretory pathway TraG/TraD family ATPase VirD4
VPEVTLILDEAASLGPDMPAIETVLQIGRKFGIRGHFYYQSRGNLAKCWPKDGGQTLLSNVTQIYTAPNDTETAADIEKRLGEFTTLVQSESSGTSISTQGGQHPSQTKSFNSGRQTNQIGRKLMKLEEILTMDERVALVFVQGMNPIWTRLERAYEGRIGPPRFPALRTFLATAALAVAAVIVTSILWSSK